ncbi:MAG: class I SAM-dependent RNA methyltransferase [Bergeyella sp.]|nr:class I SAM-dependent RNA methyltransferase [Bergeyella sp.]
MQRENFTLHIKTFFGLEKLLAEEIKKLGGKNVTPKNRALHCEGDIGFLYKINYASRLALKILVPIREFRSCSTEDLYKKVKKIPWDQYINTKQTFAIDPTVHSEIFTHSKFALLKTKDAIADFFYEKYKERPGVDTNDPHIKINLHIDQENITLSLDSSGDPLYKRGYKEHHGKAPINEVLASGMLQIAGWEGKGNFLDPMCGSGTLLIEAAMIAQNLPAQLWRKKFSFQNWKNYDADLFKKIKSTRIEKIRENSGKILGYDLNKKILSLTKKNIERLDLEGIIEIKNQDFFESKKEHFPLLIVFNPPYNERMEIEDEDFYKKIGNTLKHHYPNTFSWLITSDLEATKKIGLRPSRKIKLYNGKLETQYLQYETYEGSKKKQKKEFCKYPSLQNL